MREGSPLRVAFESDRNGFRENNIRVKGRNTHYLSAGEPSFPTVLLLHGVVAPAFVAYQEVIGPLSNSGFYAVAPDLPGHGETDDPISYNTKNYVQFVSDFMDELEIKSAHLAGISFGGALALGTALEKPERVEKLVLVNSYGFGEELHIPVIDGYRYVRRLLRTLPKEKIAARLFQLSFLSQAILGLKHIFKDQLKKPAKFVVNRFITHKKYADTEMPDEELQSLIDGRGWPTLFSWLKTEMQPSGPQTNFVPQLEAAPLRHSTLLVKGAKDKIVPPEWANIAHSLIPDSRVITFENSAHGLTLDEPYRFADEVTTFLK